MWGSIQITMSNKKTNYHKVNEQRIDWALVSNPSRQQNLLLEMIDLKRKDLNKKRCRNYTHQGE